MDSISNDGLRKRRGGVKTVFKQLDAFPKIPDTYQETSTSGGTISILVFLFLTVLVISEFSYYTSSVKEYSFGVDTDADLKLKINIDVTVAMECDDLGADVLDLSGSSIDTATQLKMEPTYFKLSKNQKHWLNALHMARGNNEGYRTINDVHDMNAVFGNTMPTYMPEKDLSEFEGQDFNACRVHGSLSVNKVAGNFHFTAGKSIPHPRGHAHLSSLVSELNYNFSHRIDLLSFGEPHPGILNPLDGDLMITGNTYHMFQYYIKIVPTNVNTFSLKMKTNQYSVTQRSRKIDHTKGSHGVPGVFFKYDLHPISVNVLEKHKEFSQFLIRLCGIVGGVFATSGMLHSFLGFLSDVIMRQLDRRKVEKVEKDQSANSGLSQSICEGIPNVSVLGQQDATYQHSEPILNEQQAIGDPITT